MRISLALVLAVAIATAVFAVSRDDGDPAASDSGAVTMVGDSLNVGVEPYLRDELPGWRIDAYDRVGRTTADGIERLRELDGELSPVVVVSLGTNDPDGSEDAFRVMVDEAIAIAGDGRCLLWATIVRGGTARTAFNAVLEAATAKHSKLRLVDWAALTASPAGLLSADLVHGTPTGYARRAEETARAARACPRDGS
jgi:hypothetical protein